MEREYTLVSRRMLRSCANDMESHKGVLYTNVGQFGSSAHGGARGEPYSGFEVGQESPGDHRRVVVDLHTDQT